MIVRVSFRNERDIVVAVIDGQDTFVRLLSAQLQVRHQGRRANSVMQGNFQQAFVGEIAPRGFEREGDFRHRAEILQDRPGVGGRANKNYPKAIPSPG